MSLHAGPTQQSIRPVGRMAAALALASAGVHVVTFAREIPNGSAVVMLLLALACAACAVELWKRPTRRAWLAAAGINILMISVHLFLMERPAATMPMHAAHGSESGGMEMAGSSDSHQMALAMALALAEIAIAVTVLARERRTTR